MTTMTMINDHEHDMMLIIISFIFIHHFTPFLQFVFFVGWLEVAESIENPFGNDDDDFQVKVFLFISSHGSSHYLISYHESNSTDTYLAQTLKPFFFRFLS